MKTLSFYQWLLLGILFINYPLFSNNPNAPIGVVKGVVVESDRSVFVEYATVALFSVKDSTMIGGVVTNSKGVFVLDKIPEGKYFLKIQFMGFQPQVINNVEISKSSPLVDLKTLVIKPLDVLLSETSVSAEKRQIEYSLDKKVINASGNIAASGGTAVDVLRSNPSVNVDIEDNVSLRGSTNYQVLINNRPSSLSGAEALKQIQASSIDKIEIITNPSASHDASGSAGIINIITHQKKQKGTAAFANAAFGNDRLTYDANINHQTKKWNWVAGYRGMNYNIPIYANRDRKYTNIDSLGNLNEDAVQYHITKSNSFTFGVDYDLDKNNLFSLSLNSGYWLHIHDFESKYTNSGHVNTHTLSQNYFKIGHQFNTGNLNYKHLFEKKQHELNANFYFSMIEGYRILESNHHLTTSEWQKQESIAASGANELSKTLDYRLNMDYKLPMKEKYLLETGIQIDNRPYEAEMDFSRFQPMTHTWFLDRNYTNDIVFNTSTTALYTTFSGAYRKLEYKAGLRGEYYERNFEMKQSQEKYDYVSADLFPSLHLSYKSNPENQFQVSYSRRVERPHAWLMYPVPDFEDLYMSSAGNPDLKPEITDSYELGYIRNISGGIISAELFQKNSENSFSRLLLSDSAGRLFQKTYNVGNFSRTGFEFAINKDFHKKIAINFASSFYYFRMAYNVQDYPVKESWTGNLRLNTSVSIKKTLKGQVNLSYNAPMKDAQGEYSQSLMATLALRKDFPKQKISVSIGSQNPIWGRFYKSHVYESGFDFRSNDLIKPSYYISIQYRINNFKRNRSIIDNSNLGEGVS